MTKISKNKNLKHQKQNGNQCPKRDRRIRRIKEGTVRRGRGGSCFGVRLGLHFLD